jgi:hypothetical protein
MKAERGNEERPAMINPENLGRSTVAVGGRPFHRRSDFACRFEEGEGRSTECSSGRRENPQGAFQSEMVEAKTSQVPPTW